MIGINNEEERRIENLNKYFISLSKDINGMVWQHSIAYTKWLCNLK